ncbi:permease-like cell division protein FtsX [Nocardioides mesophilus]|uniref:Cell division protein FtsX n=1 Tax=Nocardioides mesophilus TaxID=433659 RepID=A0A7G9RD65_9ACTN|nr:permease-like cell division protein FtsX [Nocardioides mesophilus]QNN53540.1 ABC transporter permease [Nocardioides mesophilus]
MQLTYVFSELGNGLKRNVSMSIAVIVTIFVSLTLVGMGLLLNAQAQKAENYWGSKLQITVFLCNQNSTTANCVNGEVTDAQKQSIEDVLDSNGEVASWRLETKQQAYDKWREAYVSNDETEQRVYESIRPSDMQESYWIQLKDPEKFMGIKSAVQGLPGVNSVRDLREVLKPIYFWMNVMKWGAIGIAIFLVIAAVLQVGNTIRLAAFARRREIGIMRLVGASSLYIQLPFLMESLVAALVGVGLAAGALLLFMWAVIYNTLRPTSNIVAWVDWADGFAAVGWIALIGLALTLVPTLIMTRKYLKV